MKIIDICVVVFLSLAVLSKLADVLTTLRYVCADTESNPLGQWLMRRFGMQATCWGIFVIELIIAFMIGLISMLWDNTFIKIFVSVEGVILTAFHLSAGYYNMYRRQNVFVRIGLWLNSQLARVFRKL